MHRLKLGVTMNGMYNRDVVLRQCCFLTFMQHREGSVCLAVMLCTVGLKVSVRIESCTIMFLGGHFLHTDTFAVGCVICPQMATVLKGIKSRPL